MPIHDIWSTVPEKWSSNLYWIERLISTEYSIFTLSLMKSHPSVDQIKSVQIEWIYNLQIIPVLRFLFHYYVLPHSDEHLLEVRCSNCPILKVLEIYFVDKAKPCLM